MKFFITIALIATVASAAIIKPTAVSSELAEIQEIIAAINSPSTNPATAAALEELLFDLLGVKPEPIAVGPAIVETEYEPISVGPALVDFQPEIPAPSPSASAPLVQIILNINQAAGAESAPIAPAPVVIPGGVEESAPEVIETAPIAINPIGMDNNPEPISVVETAPVEAEPVQVIETAPIAAEPVIIGTPIIPAPAVVLPESLN